MKKKTKKVKSKKQSTELVIRVEQPVLPTAKDLEPMKDGGKYMIPKTWLAEKQVLKIIQKTPHQYIYKRPGKGGQTFSYVTGNYVEKVLNYTFGWNWDFEVVSSEEKYGQVIVRGKLTVKDDHGHSITKMQSGRADIKFLKNTKIPVDYGNDEKAATTDALKKCASLLGIASDIYGKAEYKNETNTEIVDTSHVVVSDSKRGEFDDVITCSVCDSIITPQEANYSQKMFKKNLCRLHQKK